MNEKIFTFWEGPMPAYIKLCMATWKVPHIVLNYETVNDYTGIDINAMKRFGFAKQADIVRAHVLRDNGGYWLDADTIMLTDRLPEGTVTGYPDQRTNTVGFLHTEPHSDFFEAWAAYQDGVMADPNPSKHWSVVANMFTDPYVREHTEIQIVDVRKFWPETYMIKDNIPRCDKYTRFYFGTHHHLSDIEPTDMLMLHNSWTPKWYKDLSESEVLAHNCTLSNILRELQMEDRR